MEAGDLIRGHGRSYLSFCHNLSNGGGLSAQVTCPEALTEGERYQLLSYLSQNLSWGSQAIYNVLQSLSTFVTCFAGVAAR